MKAAYVKAPFEIVVKEAPRRALTDTEVRLDIHACGVCGHDLILMRYAATELQQFGHEVVGVITEVGRLVENVKVGDRVVYYYNEHCGSCYYCRNGQEQFCENMTGTSAAFSDYIVVREQSVHKLADTCSLKKGALIEPISVCLHGIDLCDVRPADTVLVIGCGMIGLLMIQLARAAGATTVVLSEPVAVKREKARKL